MNIVDKANQTQITHIQEKTGKFLDQLNALINASGPARHAEIREILKRDLDLGHGDANTLARFYLQPAPEETVRHDWSGNEYPRGGWLEYERRDRHTALEGNARWRDVPVQGQCDPCGGSRYGADWMAASGL